MVLKMYGVSVCVVCSAPGLLGLGLPHMWPRNIEHCIVSCALFDEVVHKAVQVNKNLL